MNPKSHLTTQPINTALLSKRMLIGAAFALILIVVFLSGVKHPRPEWGQFWMVRPLIVVPAAGATGGAFSYFLSYLHSQGRLNKVVAVMLSLLIYTVGLWLGTILGLAGTLWH